jgi:LmbE family N-acetylglucosaminyl deacetylase
MSARRRGEAQADEHRGPRPSTAVHSGELRRRLGLRGRDCLQRWLESTARYEQPESLGRRPMIVVAHADDETLGCGGLIAILAASGVLPWVVVMTTDGPAGVPPGDDAVAVRRQELYCAMDRLGLPASRVVVGSFRDGAMAEDEHEIHEFLLRTVQSVEPDVLIVTSRWDAHVDHRAVGRAAGSVARKLSMPCYEFFVWGWLYPRRVLAVARAERKTGGARWGGWWLGRPVGARLGGPTEDAKRAALGCYVSQLDVTAAKRGVMPTSGFSAPGGALSDDLLRYCVRPVELFFRCRARDVPVGGGVGGGEDAGTLQPDTGGGWRWG